MVTPLNADPADLAEVERLVRAAGTSFYHGMRILPADRRAAMYAIYAFCRLVDDIADEPAPIERKRDALREWRRRIVALSRGETSDATTRVLLPAMRRYALRQSDFLAVIDGMETDAETVVVAPSAAELDMYCDRVASAVGRLSVRAFGDGSAAADVVAHHLGRALQLTNILRDIAEDSARGRIYLPREKLAAAGIPPVPADIAQHPGFPAVCEDVAAEARGHFVAAEAAMKQCRPSAMRPARIMGVTYAAILARLQRRGWTRLDQPVSLPKWQKAAIALRYAVFS
jgi:squalene synthase HpnD